MTNPFAEGENRIIRPPATAMVIFGASGDLTHRKLVPALYNLAHDGYLPANFFVVGCSRTKMSDNEFRRGLQASVKEFSRREVNSELWQKFAKNIYYQPLDAAKPADFAALRQRLEQLGKSADEQCNHLYYLATATDHFAPIAANLDAAGLIFKPAPGGRRSVLVVEKPFGHDLASARELNRRLRSHFAESQLYRIDHYLGKETVQNILVFRFANGIFEPLWNQKYIDHIQISVCESIGVGGRAGYFEQAGILRDIVQSHLLQMLALLCIEPPYSLSDPDAIRDEKVKVLKAMKRMSIKEVALNTVRGQYTSGFVEGEKVPGYREEKGVSPQSLTDTYVALKLEIENWRWAGVPIYIRAGKRLPKRITELMVFFKQPPSALFRGRQVSQLESNVLAIQVQPSEGISLKINSKPPGPRMRVNPVELDFRYGGSYGMASPEAYERLLLDGMRGDPTLFTRDDEIEEAWDVLTPVWQGWDAGVAQMYEYQAGSWGPQPAEALLQQGGRSWRKL